MRDFDIYQGSVNGIWAKGQNCKIYADKYKFPLKSCRWYMYVFWHTIILAAVNAWLLYKRDCKALKMSSKDTTNRRQFQEQLASSLILVNTTLQTPKRGQTSSGKGSPATQTVTSGSPLHAQKRSSNHWLLVVGHHVVAVTVLCFLLCFAQQRGFLLAHNKYYNAYFRLSMIPLHCIIKPITGTCHMMPTFEGYAIFYQMPYCNK